MWLCGVWCSLKLSWEATIENPKTQSFERIHGHANVLTFDIPSYIHMENCRIFFSDEVMFLVFSGEIKMWLKLLEGIYKFFI